MEVIEFPGAKRIAKKLEESGLKLKRSKPSHDSYLCVGPIHFTCTNCSNQTTLLTENMIFRTLEFYCSECGTLHKITNPAFADSVQAQTKFKKLHDNLNK